MVCQGPPNPMGGSPTVAPLLSPHIQYATVPSAPSPASAPALHPQNSSRKQPVFQNPNPQQFGSSHPHSQQQLFEGTGNPIGFESQMGPVDPNSLRDQSMLPQLHRNQQRLQFQQQLPRGIRNDHGQSAEFDHQPFRESAPLQMNPDIYKPEYLICARRLAEYINQQRHNNQKDIDSWKRFVAEFFAPNAKKRWCVSTYGSGRRTTAQDAWHCTLCSNKCGHGFEATFEDLPRLFESKYDGGLLVELLFVDVPTHSLRSSGQVILEYRKAIQQSVYEQFRVIRDGILRIVFNTDLKICSWEFCMRKHEVLIPRNQLTPKISQLGAAVHKCHASIRSTQSNLSAHEMQNNCNAFARSARLVAKAVEMPSVNDLGFTKRFVRCLQISEVLNSMTDVIDYSIKQRTGPIDSLIKFSQSTSPVTHAREARNENPNDQSSPHACMQPTSQNLNANDGIALQSSRNSRHKDQMSMGAQIPPHSCSPSQSHPGRSPEAPITVDSTATWQRILQENNLWPCRSTNKFDSLELGKSTYISPSVIETRTGDS